VKQTLDKAVVQNGEIRVSPMIVMLIIGVAFVSLFVIGLGLAIALSRRTNHRRIDSDDANVPPLVDAPSDDPNPYTPSRVVPSKA
jgi:hypothetical protein